MSKKVYNADGTVAKHKVKNSGGRRGLLICGLTFSLISFAAVLATVIIMFVPNLSFTVGSATPFIFCIYLNAIGTGLAFLGIVLTVSGANSGKGLARFSFFFGIIAFILGAALLVIALLFKTILPLNIF